MPDPGPQADAATGARRITLVLCAAWTVAFLGAFVAFFVTPASDFGLAAGWNKVGVFMGWQAVAAVLAILAGVASRAVPRGQRLRWIGLVPLGFLLLLVTGFAALIVYGNMQRSAPVGAVPAAVTAPVPVTPEVETE